MKVGAGKIATELNSIENMLKELGLLEERNYSPSADFDPAEYRTLNYVETWQRLVSNNIYTFSLIDNSIIHFKYASSNAKASFSFYECPFDCLSYEDFLEQNQLDNDYDGSLFSSEYELYIQTCDPIDFPLMIRYDLDCDAYYEGLHPVSHIHLGAKNQIRIGIQKVLTPSAFVHFILRQHYPAIWKELIVREDQWKSEYIRQKNGLLDVESAYWKTLDIAEFHLY